MQEWIAVVALIERLAAENPSGQLLVRNPATQQNVVVTATISGRVLNFVMPVSVGAEVGAHWFECWQGKGSNRAEW